MDFGPACRKKPMRTIFIVCASAVSGQAAAPPMNAMNSRRFIALTQTQELPRV
jgi:hypothetical protein